MTSDGGLPPQPLDGDNSMLESIFNMVEAQGVKQYVDHIRKIEQDDKWLDQYPRFKVHDDSTVLYAKWNNK